MRSKGVAMEANFAKMSTTHLNTFQKLVIIGSSLTELNQLIHMTFIVDIYECKHYRLLLLSVIRPSIEYGSEVWEGNKSQAGSLESIILNGAKRILGCSSKTCNEAVRGDMCLDTLQSRRDRAKLKWWYKLTTLPEDGTISSCLIRSGILNHVEKAEESVE